MGRGYQRSHNLTSVKENRVYAKKKTYGYQERDESKRQSFIEQLANQTMAPFTIEGSCNRTVFEIWLKTCLIPLLKPGQIVVMDNATFHKGGNIEQVIQEAGCQLLYLPAYSPDFNKIERCWSWLKSRIRKQLDQFDCLRDVMEYVLYLEPEHRRIITYLHRAFRYSLVCHL